MLWRPRPQPPTFLPRSLLRLYPPHTISSSSPPPHLSPHGFHPDPRLSPPTSPSLPRCPYPSHPLCPNSLPSQSLHSHGILGLRCWKFYSGCAFPSSDLQNTTAFDTGLVLRRLHNALDERNTEEAWRALRVLLENGQFPDRSSLNRSLTLLAYGGDSLGLIRAQRLFSRVKMEEKGGLLDGDSLSLIAVAFARASLFEFAVDVLRFLVKKNYFPSMGVWTTVLGHFGSSPEGGAFAAEVFLEICQYLTKMAFDKRKISKAQVLLLSMKPDTEAFNAILKACVVAGDSVKADEIIEQMPLFEVTPDNVSFSSLIKVYGKEGRIDDLKRILSRLRRAPVVPDCSTLNALLSAYVSLGEVCAAAQLVSNWRQARQRARELGEGILSDSIAISKKCDDKLKDRKTALFNEQVEDEVFDEEPPRAGWGGALGLPNGETYSILLKGLMEKGGAEIAAKFLLGVYHSESAEYVACATAINGLLSLGLRNEANDILNEMAVRKVPAEAAAYTSLVRAYCKIPQPLKAEMVLQAARSVGHELNVSCYESLIEAYNLIQNYQGSVLVFQELLRLRIAPLEPIFTNLMEVLEKNGKPFLMRKMIEEAGSESSLKVGLHHWNTIILTFCKGRLMFDAKQTMKKMRQLVVQPDAITYSFMVNGYLFHGGKIQEILLLWPEVKEKAAEKGHDPLKLNRDLLDSFLNAFVTYGYFNRALEVIAHMEELNFFVDKRKYRNLYLKFHRNLYTSKHASQRRVDKSQERRKQVEAFKSWAGVKNIY